MDGQLANSQQTQRPPASRTARFDSSPKRFVPLTPRPLVSIIVRTHGKRLGFLQQAVASIVEQTYRPLEIVIVEDGTTFAARWIKELKNSLHANNDPRDEPAAFTIKYLPIPRGGRCVAGNEGLAAATGDLCGFLDDDDLLAPHHSRTLVDAHLAHQGIGAVFAAALEAPTKLKSQSPLRYEELGRSVVRGGVFDRQQLAKRNLMPIQSVLFRRELFEQHGGLDERLDALEDWDLWRRYSSDAQFLFVDAVTSVFRVPGDAESARRRQLVFRDYQAIVARLWRVDPQRSELGEPQLDTGQRSTPAPVSLLSTASRPLRSRFRCAIRDYLLKRPRLYAAWWKARTRWKCWRG